MAALQNLIWNSVALKNKIIVVTLSMNCVPSAVLYKTVTTFFFCDISQWSETWSCEQLLFLCHCLMNNYHPVSSCGISLKIIHNFIL